MGEIIENKKFAVKNDGTIVLDTDKEQLNKEILEVIEISSYSHKILAAYKAREIAYDICKTQYDKPNYMDYVEMIMRLNRPVEYKKAEIGRKYKLTSRLLVFMPWFFMIFIPIMIVLKRKHKKLLKKSNIDI